MLDNKYIHTECELVLDDDLKEATEVGLKMLAFAKKENWFCLAANQVGYNKQVVVVRDNDGYDIYFNPEIERVPLEDGMFAVSQESFPIPADIPSFPKKRVLIDVVKDIKVNVFSMEKDDRITFTADGALAKVWQIMGAVLAGVDKEAIVERDYQTIRRDVPKKRPNDKCIDCGRKNKKCVCPKPDPSSSSISINLRRPDHPQERALAAFQQSLDRCQHDKR